MFLSKASGQDVGSLMNSWIREIGFPVVKVSILKTPEAEESGITTIQMTQQRDALLTLRQKLLNKILLGHFTDKFQIGLSNYRFNSSIGKRISVAPKIHPYDPYPKNQKILIQRGVST